MLSFLLLSQLKIWKFTNDSLIFQVLGCFGAIHVLRILVEEDDSCKCILKYKFKLKLHGDGLNIN